MNPRPSLIFIEKQAVRDFLSQSSIYQLLTVNNMCRHEDEVTVLSALETATTFSELDKLFEDKIQKNKLTGVHRLGLFFVTQKTSARYLIYQLWLEYDAYVTRMESTYQIGVLKSLS